MLALHGSSFDAILLLLRASSLPLLWPPFLDQVSCLPAREKSPVMSLYPLPTSISSGPISTDVTCCTAYCSAPHFDPRRGHWSTHQFCRGHRLRDGRRLRRWPSRLDYDAVSGHAFAIPRLIFLLVLITALDPLLRHAMATHGLQGLIGYSKIFILISVSA